MTNAAEALPKEQDGSERQRLIAQLGLSSIVPNATTARGFGKGTVGEMGLMESVVVMTEKARAVRAGDLSGVETTLISQAVALDTIFNELALRAVAHMNNNLPAAETFLRLGLKAQAQCRATLQTLAEIKNPHPIAFVKQANIAHGPQQVNNAPPSGETSFAKARAGNSAKASNELLEVDDGARLDTGTEAAAGRTHTRMEAVAAGDRFED